MWFSQRKQLEDKYYEWIKEHGVKDCPMSVIAFLDLNGYLVEDKPKKKAKEGVAYGF